MFTDPAKLLVIIALVLTLVDWRIVLRGMIGGMTKMLITVPQVWELFLTTLATANETDKRREPMQISAAKKFIEAHRNIPSTTWHEEIRNNAKYGGKITHVTLAEDRRRYIYLLKDKSRLMVSHVVVDGKETVITKLIM